MKIIHLWDSVKNYAPDFADSLKFYDLVYVFEADDIRELKSRGICSKYLPLGYNGNVFGVNQKVNRDIDISFIGQPDDGRFETVEAIAKLADCSGFSLYVCGEWYDNKHFWRKRKFRQRHPELYKYIDNRMILADEAASIYSRSKISLNINRMVHHSINPRSFEILASSSCMFMNQGPDVEGVLIPGVDYVEYGDVDDLIAKIQWLLADTVRLGEISCSGHNRIKDRYSMQALYGKVLQDIWRDRFD